MSTHDKLYGILFYLGLWSPAAAIIFAGIVYDRNRRRGSLAAYLVISLFARSSDMRLALHWELLRRVLLNLQAIFARGSMTKP